MKENPRDILRPYRGKGVRVYGDFNRMEFEPKTGWVMWLTDVYLHDSQWVDDHLKVTNAKGMSGRGLKKGTTVSVVATVERYSKRKGFRRIFKYGLTEPRKLVVEP